MRILIKNFQTKEIPPLQRWEILKRKEVIKVVKFLILAILLLISFPAF